MKGLIYKDLMTEVHELRRTLLFSLFALFVLPFLFSMAEEDKSSMTFMPLVMGPVVGMAMINNTFGYDEKSGWMQYALTNPISRMQYYHAKFLTHGINVLLGCAVGFAAALLLSLFCGILTLSVLEDMVVQMAGSAVGLSLAGLVFIPLYLKFGVQKGAIIVMVLFMVFGVGGSALGIMSLLTMDNLLGWVPILIFAIAAGLLLTMYLLGRKWVKEKEF